MNEAAWMASEALRLETIDIVGPAGTPDNGYEVAVSHDGTEFVVRPGTMYVGGWRMRLTEHVKLNDQPDWQDQPPPVPPTTTVTSLLALLAIEQSVTAIEDQALREVALGGPDTAARMRLMQRFILVPTAAGTCATAAADLTKQLPGVGLTFHPESLELTYGRSKGPFSGSQTGSVRRMHCADRSRPRTGYIALIHVDAWSNDCGRSRSRDRLEKR